MANAGAPVQRFYDLDVLRAVTMFLGIVLHAGVFVLPEAIPIWPIHDEAATGDPTYKLVIEALHAFRMPVFFLLSGFFCTLLWQRRKLAGYGCAPVAAHRPPFYRRLLHHHPALRLASCPCRRIPGTIRFPSLGTASDLAVRYPRASLVSLASVADRRLPGPGGPGWACSSGIPRPGGW